MTEDVHSAGELVREVERQIAATDADIERLTSSKRGNALASARGDKKAGAAIASANAGLAAAKQRRDDLALALEGARRELDEAKQREQTAQDADRGAMLEERLAELVASRAKVDTAMGGLGAALDAHHRASWALKTSLPRGQDLEHLGFGLGEPLLIRLALEHFGLAAELGLPVGGAGKPLSAHSLAPVQQYAASLRRELPQAA